MIPSFSMLSSRDSNAWCELTTHGYTEGVPTGRIALSSPR
jgi:hypothetical protein